MSDPVKNRPASDNLLHSDLLIRVLGGDAMQILRCGICMEFFDIPIVLPCGHTFCLQCLTEMCRHASRNNAMSSLKDVRIGCPHCRVLIYATPILERNVTCNFIIQSLLECLRVKKLGKPTSLGVNTDEVRVSGKVRALSDVELAKVTGDVERLVTSLECRSVLDNACMEVEDIRRQHLADMQQTQKGEKPMTSRKKTRNVFGQAGQQASVSPITPQQTKLLQQLQAHQPNLQHPLSFLGLDALNAPLLTLNAPPGFPPHVPPHLPHGTLTTPVAQNQPFFQQQQQHQPFQMVPGHHHQQQQQQQQHQHQSSNYPHHHHHHQNYHQQHQQQHQQQQQQQYTLMQPQHGAKTSKTVAVVPLKRLLGAPNGSIQTFGGTGPSTYGPSGQSVSGHGGHSFGGHGAQAIHGQGPHALKGNSGHSLSAHGSHSMNVQGGHSVNVQVGNAMNVKGGHSMNVIGGHSMNSQGGNSLSGHLGLPMNGPGSHPSQGQHHSEGLDNDPAVMSYSVKASVNLTHKTG